MSATSTISVEIDALPQCEVFDARKEHKATVFFLHGLGDTARNLGYLVSYTWKHTLLDHVKLVMPTAPLAPLTINSGRMMSTWFDVYSSDHVNRQEDEPGLHRAASMLNGLIQDEHQKHGIPYDRIIIGGISQGGAVSLLTALTTLHPIGGVFVLSSYITLRKKIPEILSPKSKDLSIFWGHGDSDKQVNHDAWKELAEILAREIGIPFRYYHDDGSRLEAESLKKSGANALLFHTYEGLGHWFDEKEIEDLIIWISVVLG
jgi:predicted esterase